MLIPNAGLGLASSEVGGRAGCGRRWSDSPHKLPGGKGFGSQAAPKDLAFPYSRTTGG